LIRLAAASCATRFEEKLDVPGQGNIVRQIAIHAKMRMIRKLLSAWKMAFSGEWIPFVNVFLRLLRLNRCLWISDTLMFIKPPPACQNESLPPEQQRFEILRVNDPAIVPELVQCLDGTKDYHYTSLQLKDKFEKMFLAGSCVWIARDTEKEGRIAGLLWITSHQYSIQERIRLLLPNALAFQEFVFTHEDYRRLGLYSRILQTAHRQSPSVALGSIISFYNVPSIQAHQKLGFQKHGRIIYFYLFGRMLATFRFGNVRKRLFRIKSNELYQIDISKGKKTP